MKKNQCKVFINTTEFRKELIKVMPGYLWTVHRPSEFTKSYLLSATGIQSSGSNRLSTLQIIRKVKDDKTIEYTAKSSGFGLRSPWLSEYTDRTLKRVLRSLQNHYEIMANEYRKHACAIKFARVKRVEKLLDEIEKLHKKKG